MYLKSLPIRWRSHIEFGSQYYFYCVPKLRSQLKFKNLISNWGLEFVRQIRNFYLQKRKVLALHMSMCINAKFAVQMSLKCI